MYILVIRMTAEMNLKITNEIFNTYLYLRINLTLVYIYLNFNYINMLNCIIVTIFYKL